jgi:DNA-directed RNA polymerase specialized sigma24 family protein
VIHFGAENEPLKQVASAGDRGSQTGNQEVDRLALEARSPPSRKQNLGTEVSRTMAGTKSSPKFWIHPESSATGRPRSQTLIAAAEKVWPYVAQNCESILRDAPAAGEIMERSLLALERRRASTKISDVAAFLARIAIREIRREFQRRIRESGAGLVFDLPSSSDVLTHDRRILASQVLALVREEMLDLFLKHLAGMTWADIGTIRGEDPHALESRFSYEIARIRRLLKIPISAKLRGPQS